MQSVHEATSEMTFSDSLIEYLPNQEFRVNDNEPIRLSGGIIVGNVTGVSPGRGYVTSSSGTDARGQAVAFDAPDAEWRIAQLEITVEKWFAEGPVPKSVQVGAFVPHPEGKLGAAELRGLAALGKIVVVLDPERGYDWDEKLVPVARGGALLGDIDLAGEIGFPALSTDSTTFVGSASIADLEKAWASKQEPIRMKVDMESGIISRE